MVVGTGRCGYHLQVLALSQPPQRPVSGLSGAGTGGDVYLFGNNLSAAGGVTSTIASGTLCDGDQRDIVRYMRNRGHDHGDQHGHDGCCSMGVLKISDRGHWVRPGNDRSLGRSSPIHQWTNVNFKVCNDAFGQRDPWNNNVKLADRPMMKYLLSVLALGASLIGIANAQCGMMPGPGTPHTTYTGPC